MISKSMKTAANALREGPATEGPAIFPNSKSFSMPCVKALSMANIARERDSPVKPSSCDALEWLE